MVGYDDDQSGRRRCVGGWGYGIGNEDVDGMTMIVAVGGSLIGIGHVEVGSGNGFDFGRGRFCF